MSSAQHNKRKSRPSSSSSSGGGDDLRPRRAFQVHGYPDFTQAEPQTAEEYLRRVKWEAKKQPKVLTSSIDPRQFDHQQTKGYFTPAQLIPATSPLVLPSVEWENDFASQFADVRLSFVRYLELHPAPTSPPPSTPALPPSRDYPAWTRYCLGVDYDVERCIRAPRGADEAVEVGEKVRAMAKPELSVVAGWDQVTTRAICHRLIDHLVQCQQRLSANEQPEAEDEEEDEGEDVDEEGGGVEKEEESKEPSEAATITPPSAVDDSSLTSTTSPSPSPVPLPPPSFLSLPRPSHTQWLFAALAHLEKPLPPDSEHQLRQLYRVSGKIRAEAGERLEQIRRERRRRGSGSDEEVKEGEGKDRESAAEVESEEESDVLDCVMHCNLLMAIVDRVFGQRVEMVKR